VAELLQLQKRSSDGVIRMDSATWNKYVSGRTRPYSVVVFSSALHLLDKPNLRLRELRSEFGYMAKGYKVDAGTHGKVGTPARQTPRMAWCNAPPLREWSHPMHTLARDVANSVKRACSCAQRINVCAL